MPTSAAFALTAGDPAAALISLLHGYDDLDWTRVRAALADEVVVDYTSVFGGRVETLGADALVRRWRAVLPGFDATQHITGPVLVSAEPGDATMHLEAQARAHHLMRGDPTSSSWLIAGRYQLAVTPTVAGGWLITELTLHCFYEEGDRGLLALARSRAGTDPRPGRPARPA
ncbi:nuclear transport factor 2 family protein [Frankia sp. R82]|uniref:nuclear transport factor 2 family protein n=1 Tax=Frankia sp. R82 TaxID=2950553 RepID=UPI002043B85B|nr:nuclear transport factor 2 family protein [Frankia sp. R82]MCM3883489.1 nuclear transport factor 2 family protein [Frankia sp. R82]